MIENNKNSTFKSLILLFVKYPMSFVKQLNFENLNTLKRAILNEPSSQIVSNAKKLLNKTNKDSIDGVYARIGKFVESIENPNNLPVSIFISHESTVTGAPLIILNLAKGFAEKYKVLPIQILCLGGDLDDEFKKVGHTYILEFYHNRVLLKREVKALVEQLKARFTMQNTFVNSEGSTRLLPYLRKNKAGKIVSLIHEMGDYYPKGSWSHIEKNSDKIIFPAQYVKEKAFENTNFTDSKVHVIGQGLLKPELLEESAADYRSIIRKELKIPKESKIVLGCGSLIPRKGIDIFIFTAISTLNRIDNNEVPVYFIWIGEADFNDHQIWANRDIQYSGHSDRIQFIGAKKNTIPYFKGSDIFLLTSRGDPFPCVVHEALAAGMPVIGFKNAGGVQEMIDPTRGYLANYGDIQSTSNKILEYLDNPEVLGKQKSNASAFAKKQLDFLDYVEKVFEVS